MNKKAFEVELNAEYIVTFPDEQKTIDYFIEGDWRDSFFDFSSLQDMARSIIYDFHNADREFVKNKDDKYESIKSLEGYPTFVRDDNNMDKWAANCEECGTIIVELTQELDVEYTTEVED